MDVKPERGISSNHCSNVSGRHGLAFSASAGDLLVGIALLVARSARELELRTGRRSTSGSPPIKVFHRQTVVALAPVATTLPASRQRRADRGRDRPGSQGSPHNAPSRGRARVSRSASSGASPITGSNFDRIGIALGQPATCACAGVGRGSFISRQRLRIVGSRRLH